MAPTPEKCLPPRIFLSPPHLGGKEQTFVKEAFESNYIAPLGPQVDAFEKEFCRYTGIAHAVALSSGTAAMHLALRCLDVQPQDEVFASTLTFIGSVSPITFLQATPVFIDADPGTWNIDPDLLESELERCRKKGKLPKAVVPTDLYGQCADIDRIQTICRPHGIPVIIDSAESVGATYKGRHAGKGADAAVFSFNGNKIITTSGGGMLASDNAQMIAFARFLSQQARDDAPHYQHSIIGYNYRMSNLLAAVGRGQLHLITDRVARKRDIYRFYRDQLGDVPGITLMPEAPDGIGNRWLTVILIDAKTFGADRETVRLALEKENIESRPVWKPMHLQPVFSSNRRQDHSAIHPVVNCRTLGGEVSEKLFQNGLCLPSGTALTSADLDRIVHTVLSTPNQENKMASHTKS